MFLLLALSPVIFENVKKKKNQSVTENKKTILKIECWELWGGGGNTAEWKEYSAAPAALEKHVD